MKKGAPVTEGMNHSLIYLHAPLQKQKMLVLQGKVLSIHAFTHWLV